MAHSSEVAEKVKDAINGGTYTSTFQAIRRWNLVEEKKDLSSLSVVVAPARMVRQPITRDRIQVEHVIQVAIRKSVDPADTTEVDALHKLADAIGKAIEGVDFSVIGVQWSGTEIPVLLDYEDLRTMRVFTSIISLSFLDWQLRGG
jgi:hypothetical protein